MILDFLKLQLKFFNNLTHSIKNNILSSLLILLLFSFLNSIGQTATQGSSGSTSSGSVDVNVVVSQTIIIHDLRDYNFGLWNLGDGTLIDNDNVCIGKTNFQSPYAVRASGDGDGFDPAAFTLSNGAAQLYYNVYWNDEVGTVGNMQLSPGLILSGQTGSVPSFAQNRNNCNRPNANLEIEITDTELQNATSGFYTGTLTLIVIPE